MDSSTVVDSYKSCMQRSLRNAYPCTALLRRRCKLDGDLRGIQDRKYTRIHSESLCTSHSRRTVSLSTRLHLKRIVQNIIFRKINSTEKEKEKCGRSISITFLTVDLRISVVSRWTRALSLPVNYSALCVEAADTMLQARICANAILAASFVGLAVVVMMAFQLVTFLTGFSLVSFWA